MICMSQADSVGLVSIPIEEGTLLTKGKWDINTVLLVLKSMWYRCFFRLYVPVNGGRCGLVVNTSDSGSRGRGFEPHSGRCVVSLCKTYLPPKNTGNTKEAVAPSQYV